jgi:T4 gene Gp59 loader of gp41 DNA helicase
MGVFMLSGYEACRLYMALKLHFEVGPYDFFRYNGKIKWLTPSKFELRKDRWFFHKLSKRYPDPDTCTFFLASNFFDGTTTWVRDLLGEEAKSVYLEKLRVKESLMYLVLQDVDAMLPNFKDYLSVHNGENPLLLNMAYQGEVEKETVVALNAAIGFLPIWEKKITDTILFPTFKHKCLAYEPFLGIDKKKFRETLKMRLTNT